MDKVQDSRYPTEWMYLTLPIYAIRSDIDDPCMHIYHSQSFKEKYLHAVFSIPKTASDRLPLLSRDSLGTGLTTPPPPWDRLRIHDFLLGIRLA